MSKRLRMSGQRWAGVMRDVDPNGGSGGGGGQQGQQGGQGQGQQQQGQGQGGGGSGGGSSGAGDAFWNQAGGQQGQGQGQQQGQGGGQQQGQPLTQADMQAFGASLVQQMQSEFDRRVNQIVNGQRGGRNGQGGQPGQGQGQNGGQGNGGQQNGGQQAPVYDHEVIQLEQDRREARMAFRDYVGEGITFLDTEERGLAHAIGAQLLANQQAYTDPDLVGRNVAAEVQAKVRGIRETYRKAVIESLRRSGQYVEKPAGGQGQNGGSAPANLMPSFANSGNGANKFDAAAAAAAQYNQANGHPAPAKATT